MSKKSLMSLSLIIIYFLVFTNTNLLAMVHKLGCSNQKWFENLVEQKVNNLLSRVKTQWLRLAFDVFICWGDLNYFVSANLVLKPV